MARNINVEINGQFVQKNSKNAGVMGEGNVTSMHITFDASWTGYGKRIVWRDANGENAVSVVLFDPIVQEEQDHLTADTTIPREPLSVPGWCSFSIEGYKEEDGTHKVSFSVSDYLFVAESDSYNKPAEPTPSQTQQILEELVKMQETVFSASLVPKTVPKEYFIDGKLNLNSIVEQGHYALDVSWTVLNGPDNFAATGLIVERFRTGDTSSFIRQTALRITTGDANIFYIRYSNVSGSWSEWRKIVDVSAEESMIPKTVKSSLVVDNTLDLNLVVEQGHYILDTSWTLLNAPDGFIPTGLIVERFRTGTEAVFVRQTAVRITSDSKKYAIRISGADGNWQPWYIYEDTETIQSNSLIPKLISSNLIVRKTLNLNSVVEQGHYILDTSWTLLNAPDGFTPTGLIVERFRAGDSSAFVRQTALKVTTGSANIFYIRYSNARGEWSDWAELEQKQNVIYYNTYKTEQYSNTYTVTATPSITTDNLYFLAAPDDGHDVTAEIQAMLNTYGTCRLGPGTYNVSGIDMPPDTQISGVGNKTVLLLSDDVESGYAVKLRSRCRVSDMKIFGSTSSIAVSETVGTRHGVMWEGDANDDSSDIPLYGSVSNCYIGNFTGGGITCYNTGYATGACIMVSDCYIINCSAGINISYWSEFNRFTNITCRACWYGCINNGGNNIFTACNFSTNKLAMLFDNSTEQSPNNTHGSMVGCILNHADSNNGTAVKMLNCKNGYTFTGCQIWYGKIELDDSEGVVFADCIMRGDEYTINGGGSILFANCQLSKQPVFHISGNQLVKAVNCYLKSTGESVEV